MGLICMSTIGGSSGPVFGTLLVTLAKELPPAPGPADLSRAVRAGMAALTKLGKAEVGQKTLLDVLDPLQRVLAEGGADIVDRARRTALDACAATAAMDAIKGRASLPRRSRARPCRPRFAFDGVDRRRHLRHPGQRLIRRQLTCCESP